MDGEILIEHATEADLMALEPLIGELLHALDSAPGIDVRRAVENCRMLLGDPNHHILLAKVDSGVVGLIGFTTRKTILHARPSGLIEELVVAQEHRGRGIGRRLIGAAIEACRQLGCEEVEVTTEKTNSVARAFYQSCGFDEDAVLLERHL